MLQPESVADLVQDGGGGIEISHFWVSPRTAKERISGIYRRAREPGGGGWDYARTGVRKPNVAANCWYSRDRRCCRGRRCFWNRSYFRHLRKGETCVAGNQRKGTLHFSCLR